MKQQLEQLINSAIESIKQSNLLADDFSPRINVERTRDSSHGDLASNIAMVCAKAAGKNPREMAQIIIDALPESSIIQKISIAGPGFINFFLSNESTTLVVKQALEQAKNFGRCNDGANKKVIVEFVSANPTGPLHVGHGRGAAYGSSLSNLLDLVGWNVSREYYVNDAGRQMHILALSVLLRYLESAGLEITFPVNGYKGEYVLDISSELFELHPETLTVDIKKLYLGVAADERKVDGEVIEGDKEKHVDGLIKNAKALLGEEKYQLLFKFGLESIRSDIEKDLSEFGVNFDNWYSEQSLMDSGAISEAITRLTEAGYMYEKDGAIWFRATDFGDDKDRVAVRDNGQTTYFASDIAYHMEKLDRGFERVIDIFGADHHGYVTRVKASMKALGANTDQIDIPLVQFAILYRGGKRVQMSTRSGSFVTLRELREEVSNDAARFFYVMRKAEQHMDFDLDLAKSKSNENPMYYIQYAHARICSVTKKLTEAGFSHDLENGHEHLNALITGHEQLLLKRLAGYPEIIRTAAKNLEPHSIAHYLKELANDFHSYYNADKFIIEEPALRNARFNLILAVKQTISNGLAILGVSAPESM
ncbi:MAG: arginine--tRNA ligase [Gammaproteobacteria bacterium]|nr:MAG: arginine--tRNA ligase [Gammaproteobacteria bacterium]